MGAERFDLTSGRPDFWSVKLDLRFERSSLRSRRPDLGYEILDLGSEKA